MKHLIFLLNILFILIFSSCDSGSSDGGSTKKVDTPTTPTPDATTQSATLAGKVVDGYISGAMVCLDLNNDNQCLAEDGDQVTLTDREGNYVLDMSNVTDEQIATARIFITGGVDISTNKPNETIMKAPLVQNDDGSLEESVNITPLTTLVAAKVGSADKAAVEQAKKEIADTLGISPDDVDKNPLEVEDTNVLKAALQVQEMVKTLSKAGLNDSTSVTKNASDEAAKLLAEAFTGEQQKEMEEIIDDAVTAELEKSNSTINVVKVEKLKEIAKETVKDLGEIFESISGDNSVVNENVANQIAATANILRNQNGVDSLLDEIEDADNEDLDATDDALTTKINAQKTKLENKDYTQDSTADIQLLVDNVDLFLKLNELDIDFSEASSDFEDLITAVGTVDEDTSVEDVFKKIQEDGSLELGADFDEREGTIKKDISWDNIKNLFNKIGYNEFWLLSQTTKSTIRQTIDDAPGLLDGSGDARIKEDTSLAEFSTFFNSITGAFDQKSAILAKITSATEFSTELEALLGVLKDKNYYSYQTQEITDLVFFFQHKRSEISSLGSLQTVLDAASIDYFGNLLNSIDAYLSDEANKAEVTEIRSKLLGNSFYSYVIDASGDVISDLINYSEASTDGSVIATVTYGGERSQRFYVNDKPYLIEDDSTLDVLIEGDGYSFIFPDSTEFITRSGIAERALKTTSKTVIIPHKDGLSETIPSAYFDDSATVYTFEETFAANVIFAEPASVDTTFDSFIARFTYSDGDVLSESLLIYRNHDGVKNGLSFNADNTFNYVSQEDGKDVQINEVGTYTTTGDKIILTTYDDFGGDVFTVLITDDGSFVLFNMDENDDINHEYNSTANDNIQAYRADKYDLEESLKSQISDIEKIDLFSYWIDTILFLNAAEQTSIVGWNVDLELLYDLLKNADFFGKHHLLGLINYINHSNNIPDSLWNVYFDGQAIEVTVGDRNDENTEASITSEIHYLDPDETIVQDGTADVLIKFIRAIPVESGETRLIDLGRKVLITFSTDSVLYEYKVTKGTQIDYVLLFNEATKDEILDAIKEQGAELTFNTSETWYMFPEDEDDSDFFQVIALDPGAGTKITESRIKNTGDLAESTTDNFTPVDANEVFGSIKIDGVIYTIHDVEDLAGKPFDIGSEKRNFSAGAEAFELKGSNGKTENWSNEVAAADIQELIEYLIDTSDDPTGLTLSLYLDVGNYDLQDYSLTNGDSLQYNCSKLRYKSDDLTGSSTGTLTVPGGSELNMVLKERDGGEFSLEYEDCDNNDRQFPQGGTYTVTINGESNDYTIALEDSIGEIPVPEAAFVTNGSTLTQFNILNGTTLGLDTFDYVGVDFEGDNYNRIGDYYRLGEGSSNIAITDTINADDIRHVYFGMENTSSRVRYGYQWRTNNTTPTPSEQSGWYFVNNGSLQAGADVDTPEKVRVKFTPVTTERVDRLEADVTVFSYDVSGDDSQIRAQLVAGYDADESSYTGEIGFSAYIRGRSNGRLYFEAYAGMCTDDECDDGWQDFDPEEGGSFPFGQSANIGQTYRLSIAYLNTGKLEIGIDGKTSTYDVSAYPTIVPVAPTYIFMRSRADVGGENQSAMINARFDNVSVNGSAFDDFSAETLDSNKWNFDASLAVESFGFPTTADFNDLDQNGWYGLDGWRDGDGHAFRLSNAQLSPGFSGSDNDSIYNTDTGDFDISTDSRQSFVLDIQSGEWTAHNAPATLTSKDSSAFDWVYENRLTVHLAGVHDFSEKSANFCSQFNIEECPFNNPINFGTGVKAYNIDIEVVVSGDQYYIDDTEGDFTNLDDYLTAVTHNPGSGEEPRDITCNRYDQRYCVMLGDYETGKTSGDAVEIDWQNRDDDNYPQISNDTLGTWEIREFGPTNKEVFVLHIADNAYNPGGGTPYRIAAIKDGRVWEGDFSPDQHIQEFHGLGWNQQAVDSIKTFLSAQPDNIFALPPQKFTISEIADGTITIDGTADDWGDISPVLTDASETETISSGVDFERVYLTKDTKNIYLRWDRAGTEIPSDHQYNFWFYMNPSESGGKAYAVEAYHGVDGSQSVRLLDISDNPDDYNSFIELQSELSVHSSGTTMEIAIPLNRIDQTSIYYLEAHAHHWTGDDTSTGANDDYKGPETSIIFDGAVATSSITVSGSVVFKSGADGSSTSLTDGYSLGFGLFENDPMLDANDDEAPIAFSVRESSEITTSGMDFSETVRSLAPGGYYFLIIGFPDGDDPGSIENFEFIGAHGYTPGDSETSSTSFLINDSTVDVGAISVYDTQN